MSYGTLLTKTVHLHVDLLDARRADEHLDVERFRAQHGRTWAAGTLAVTRLHLTFTPQRLGAGVSAFTIRMDEILQVELTEGPTNRVIGLKVGGHEVWLRARSAKKVAQSIASLAAEARDLRDRTASRRTSRS